MAWHLSSFLLGLLLQLMSANHDASRRSGFIYTLDGVLLPLPPRVRVRVGTPLPPEAKIHARVLAGTPVLKVSELC